MADSPATYRPKRAIRILSKSGSIGELVCPISVRAQEKRGLLLDVLVTLRHVLRERLKVQMAMLLEVENLKIDYRGRERAEFRAVDGVSVRVEPGEVLGLMGESGCGKSSVGLAITGLLDKRRARVTGKVMFRGENLAEMNEHALEKIRGAAISMIYQEPGIALSPVIRVG